MSFSPNKNDGNESTIKNNNQSDEPNEVVIVHAASSTPSFSDVKETHWAYPVLEKALSHNYIQGFPDGTMRANQAITRAEVSVMFDRIWKQKQKHSDAPLIVRLFYDVPKNVWFSEAVYRLKGAAVIQGLFMTRAEIAVMLYRYMERHVAVVKN